MLVSAPRPCQVVSRSSIRRTESDAFGNVVTYSRPIASLTPTPLVLLTCRSVNELSGQSDAARAPYSIALPCDRSHEIPQTSLVLAEDPTRLNTAT